MASWQRITSCVFHFLTSSREKNLVNQAAVLMCQKCAKTHLRPSEIGKKFPGVIPPDLN
jgi:hypothetical protein